MTNQPPQIEENLKVDSLDTGSLIVENNPVLAGEPVPITRLANEADSSETVQAVQALQDMLIGKGLARLSAE